MPKLRLEEVGGAVKAKPEKKQPTKKPPKKHKHHFRLWLIVTLRKKGHRRRIYRVELTPHKEVTMTPVTVSVGHEVICALEFDDQNGNPMLTPPTPDSPPTWSDSATPASAFTFTSSGVTATDVANAAGSDTISVSVSVGGVAFNATLGVTCAAAPQVLSAVRIVPTVQ